MHPRPILVLAGALLVLRLPALVQPMGVDQGLYAYVGEQILAGQLPYRDAWDQKPPAIHYLYALIRLVSPGHAGVAAADFAATAATAWLIYKLGATIAPAPSGPVGALLFLLLSNPAFTRLGGIRLRSQSETFIAVVVTGAFLLLARRARGAGTRVAVGAGILFGVAFMFKYNAGLYLVAGLLALWLWQRVTWADMTRVMAGFMVPVAVAALVFAWGGAARDLYDATITYNVQYSGETYAGPGAAMRYLATFPIERARIDALWTLGGAGCVILIGAAARRRERLVPVIWVAAAVVSIAVNGSRGLPQYFVQANPALAMAAAWGAAVVWPLLRQRSGRAARLVGATALIVISIAVWRVNQFPKLAEQTLFDARYALGAIAQHDYLARYADDRKYSALAAADLSDLVRAHTQPADRIYVFGFTCAVYVDTGRSSASRFFWSRPVIVGFKEEAPGYGVTGLLSELQRNAPALVALQRKDWDPDVSDSAAFFMRTPSLAGWLQAEYDRHAGTDAFDVWIRKSRAS